MFTWEKKAHKHYVINVWPSLFDIYIRVQTHLILINVYTWILMYTRILLINIYRHEYLLYINNNVFTRTYIVMSHIHWQSQGRRGDHGLTLSRDADNAPRLSRLFPVQCSALFWYKVQVFEPVRCSVLMMFGVIEVRASDFCSENPNLTSNLAMMWGFWFLQSSTWEREGAESFRLRRSWMVFFGA